MRYLMLTMLLLSGCAGWTCNDGTRVGMFDDCINHKGPDIQATFPNSEVDAVELVASSAYNKFHEFTVINTSTQPKGIVLNPKLKYEKDDCDVHAKWVGEQLAAQGIGGKMITRRVSDSYHAAFFTDDGRVIDINTPTPLALSEWLDFTNRL